MGKHRQSGRLTAALVALGAIAAACGSDTARADEVKSSVARAKADPALAAPAAQSLDQFSGALYGKVAAGEKGNVVLSPYSVATALAMVRVGAAGQTRAQLDTALHADATNFDAGLNAIDQALATRSGKVPQRDKMVDLSLRTANALWPQKGYPFEPAYLDALARDYGAGLHTVDYAKAEAAREAINEWVAEQTNDKIDELIAEGVLDALVRLVLTNAIYLKAPWALPFEKTATAPAVFNRLDGTTVTTDFMRALEPFKYAKGAGWQIVELPYAGEKLAMDVVVPDAGRLAAVEAELTKGVSGFTAALKPASVRLSLPKFTFRTKADLVDVLRSVGITDLFDPERADLSGVTTAEKLYVSDVIHEAFIAVDEAGTEAAAATAVVMRATAAPATPVELNVDRPFLFVIRDVETNAVLFLGRVVDPKAS